MLFSNIISHGGEVWFRVYNSKANVRHWGLERQYDCKKGEEVVESESLGKSMTSLEKYIPNGTLAIPYHIPNALCPF